jgi:DNA-binding transcriptional MerR regulator
MPQKEKETGKIYFSIGEVAGIFGVNTSLIRFWEKEFEIIKPHKNKKGNRQFTQADIDHFHIIYHLVKERGYTLQGAKEKLKAGQEEAANTLEIVKSLNKVRDFLLEIKKELP